MTESNIFSVDSAASMGAFEKLSGQLWYLSEELLTISFFYGDFSTLLHSSEHWLMMERLDKEEAQDLLKRILLDRFDRNDYVIL